MSWDPFLATRLSFCPYLITWFDLLGFSYWGKGSSWHERGLFILIQKTKPQKNISIKNNIINNNKNRRYTVLVNKVGAPNMPPPRLPLNAPQPRPPLTPPGAQLGFQILMRWIVIYPMDSAIQRLNNRGQTPLLTYGVNRVGSSNSYMLRETKNCWKRYKQSYMQHFRYGMCQEENHYLCPCRLAQAGRKDPIKP